MDPRLLDYYNQELQFIRDTGAEFAAEFPKIASRLGLDAFECADPYVERLLEGFALLSARVHVKLDAEFPRFAQQLFEVVCPHYLSPLPSMAVVQFAPDLNEGSLGDGFVVPRDTVLRSTLGKGEQTACVFRTSQDVTLWPLEIVQADYSPRDVTALDIPDLPDVRAALRLRLRTTAGLKFNQLPLDRLTLYLRGSGEMTRRMYEQLLGHTAAVVVQPTQSPAAWREVLGRHHVRRVGFDDTQALLPYGPRSFQGYRLLQEYFAFPDRFLFVELTGLQAAAQRADTELDVIILLQRSDGLLENRVDTSQFALFCSPAINLFPKRADRIHLSNRFSEHHVIPDRTRPLDFEVYRVNSVVGHGTSADQEQEFLPFFGLTDQTADSEQRAYFSVNRNPRVLSGKQRKYGPRSSYVGGEVFLSLVDSRDAPYHHNLKQLSVQTLCTNRDLTLQMPVGVGTTDFTLEESTPVQAVRCLAGPTKPRPSPCYEKGQTVWRMISHFSLNYLSLLKSDQGQGAAALRELLMLYSDTNDTYARQQIIDGVRSVEAQPVTRPLTTSGPLSFGRGIEITLNLDESRFEGSGAFLLASVLEEFFAKYVSLNSFTETVLKTTDRGEVMRWPARLGRRHLL